MAVNKNFVVKNGLEVNENLIVANATDGFVGVGTSTPNEVLHVFGGIGATDVRVTGVSSFIGDVVAGTNSTLDATCSSSMIAGGSSNKLDNNSENSMIGSGVSNLIDNQSDKSFIAAGEQNTIDRNSDR